VTAVRKALPDLKLIVDANERLTPFAADALVPGLQELGIDWLEEPFPAEHMDAHRQLAQTTGVRIAAGEHLVGTAEMMAWSRSGAAQVIQPDAALCGGVTVAFATAVALPDTSVAFHSLPELHVHLAAASTNASLVEHFPLMDAVLEQPLPWTGGTVTPPATPGTGIRWNEEIVASTRLASTNAPHH
jgi:L-alanine-DL-glutamate epimerase-like enolase superfamily enzyme